MVRKGCGIPRAAPAVVQKEWEGTKGTTSHEPGRVEGKRKERQTCTVTKVTRRRESSQGGLLRRGGGQASERKERDAASRARKQENVNEPLLPCPV